MKLKRLPNRAMYGGIGQLTTLAALAILSLALPSPANAQMGPSGSLTVQMRVGDTQTEVALDGGESQDGVESQAIGGTGSCSFISGTGFNFGVVKVQAGNKLPPLLDAVASITMLCTKPITGGGGLEPPGGLVSVAATSPNGFLMTLGGGPSGAGIGYELYTNEFVRLVDNGGFVEASLIDVGATTQQLQTTLVARVTNPFPSTLRLVPGTYRDNLTITIIF